jgi:hypothetical protein
VANALRMAIPPGTLTDYEGPRPRHDAGPGPPKSTASAGIKPDGSASPEVRDVETLPEGSVGR